MAHCHSKYNSLRIIKWLNTFLSRCETREVFFEDMEITVIPRNGVLYMASDEDFDTARRLRQNQPYKVKVSLARNYQFHKKYFALINTAWDYLTERQEKLYGNKKSFRKTLEIAAGYYEPVMDLFEERFLKAPTSIAFDKMTEEEFEDLYERVKDVLFSNVLKNIDPMEFMSNLSNF